MPPYLERLGFRHLRALEAEIETVHRTCTISLRFGAGVVDWLGRLIDAQEDEATPGHRRGFTLDRAKFVELIVAVVSLIGRMRDVNLELTKRVAHLTRKRPRSETLERLERQLVLPLEGLVAAGAKPAAAEGSKPVDKRRRRRGGGGRGAFPAYIPRVEVKNPVSADLRICPLCGQEMKPLSHSSARHSTSCQRGSSG